MTEKHATWYPPSPARAGIFRCHDIPYHEIERPLGTALLRLQPPPDGLLFRQGCPPSDGYWALRREAMVLHTGEYPLQFRGPGRRTPARPALFTKDITRLKPGRCGYGLACYDDGGMLVDGVRAAHRAGALLVRAGRWRFLQLGARACTRNGRRHQRSPEIFVITGPGTECAEDSRGRLRRRHARTLRLLRHCARQSSAAPVGQSSRAPVTPTSSASSFIPSRITTPRRCGVTWKPRARSSACS